MKAALIFGMLGIWPGGGMIGSIIVAFFGRGDLSLDYPTSEKSLKNTFTLKCEQRCSKANCGRSKRRCSR